MNDDDLRRLGFSPVGQAVDPATLPAVPGTGPGAIPILEGAAPPVQVFLGEPRVFFLAVCRECNAGSRPIPMPFGTAEDRDRWAAGHAETGHTIDKALEVRPDDHT